ncbi:MAG: RnfABCDGE type electron transport complex subunit D [Clostridiales bacterium]|nr:RnfABCDGE type electron transport complex subunit D [Clostridiales bacterium]
MKLYLSTAPHIRSEQNTQSLMRDVIIALLPTTAAGIFYFGLSAAMVIAVSVVSCVLFEYLWQRITKQPIRISDLSAAVTGLILGLNLPSTAPWWMPVIGALFAIVITKQLFGGIGDNFLNPALVARAVLLASWPARMTGATAYAVPTMWSGADAVTSATPLAGYEASTMDLFLGNIPGSIGEVCKAAILLGLVYLLVRKVITWRIPITFLAVFAVLSALVGENPVVELLSGGVLFGAVFMATDYTTSPMTPNGQYIYAALCGVLVCVIRNFGAYPEGVTYAILIGNIVTPLLDKYSRPKLYGKPKKEVKANG